MTQEARKCDWCGQEKPTLALVDTRTQFREEGAVRLDFHDECYIRLREIFGAGTAQRPPVPRIVRTAWELQRFLEDRRNG